MKKFDPQTTAHPYAEWRCTLLSMFGALLGVQFKIGGMPYGAAYDRELWGAGERDYCTDSKSKP